MEEKFMYFGFQSSQSFEPNNQELLSFQRKYKKDFINRILFEGEELLEQYRLRGWKHPRYSKIISFIIAFEVENTLRVRYITGFEKDIIQEFYNILKKSPEYTIVTFDSQITLPYLGIRATKNNLINTPHIGLKYKNLRPWDLKCLDFQQYYDGAGNYKSSLKDIAEDLNLKSNDIIETEDEFTFYNSNDFNSLKKSAIQKIEVLSKSHRLLRSLDILETILVEEKVENVIEEKPLDWLKELEQTNQLTLEIVNGLREKISSVKKKITKREKEVLFEIIRGVYIRTDFENKNQDSKKVIELKEKEINNFINSL
jgi:hypothetical protein